MFFWNLKKNEKYVFSNTDLGRQVSSVRFSWVQFMCCEQACSAVGRWVVRIQNAAGGVIISRRNWRCETFHGTCMQGIGRRCVLDLRRAFISALGNLAVSRSGNKWSKNFDERPHRPSSYHLRGGCVQSEVSRTSLQPRAAAGVSCLHSLIIIVFFSFLPRVAMHPRY